MKRAGKRTLALFLSLAMAFSLACLPAQAAPVMADAAGSWAAGSIDRWAQLGIVQGDSDGNFNPANPLSRGELATILVKMFGLTEKAENTYSDLKGDEWYADAILKCTAAGIMKGDGVSCNATAQISRQETMVMLGRAVGVVPAGEPDMSRFTDGAEVADWAAGYLAPLAEMGILTGVGDGSAAPAANIDRASMMALLDKAVVEYVNAPGEVAVDNANGFVVVNVAAGEGEVVLTGTAAGVVVASGTTGGKVVAKDLSAGTVKVDGAAAVSVEGGSTVGTVAVSAAASVEIAKSAKADAVEVTGADARLTVAGTVGSVAVAESAANTQVKAEAGAKITSVENAAEGLTVTGKGSVGAVSTTAEAKVSTPNTVTTHTETRVDAQGNTITTKTETTNNSKGEAGTVKTETTTTKPDGTTDTKTETQKPDKPSGGGSYVPTVSTWDGASADTGWYSESADAFTLSTAAELAGLAKLVNEGKDFAGKAVTLGIDIDLGGHEWTPIGRFIKAWGAVVEGYEEISKDYVGYVHPFSGIFDGNNKTISGLEVTTRSSCTDSMLDGSALFGVISGATIKNVTISNCVISSDDRSAAVAGFVIGGKADFSNVLIDGGTILSHDPCDDNESSPNYDGNGTDDWSSWSTGGIVAQIYNYSTYNYKNVSNAVVSFENCEVRGTAITGDYNVGSLWGSITEAGTIPGNLQQLPAVVTVSDCSSSAKVHCTQGTIGVLGGWTYCAGGNVDGFDFTGTAANQNGDWTVSLCGGMGNGGGYTALSVENASVSPPDNAVLNQALTIPENISFKVPASYTFTINAGKALTVNGTFINRGTVIVNDANALSFVLSAGGNIKLGDNITVSAPIVIAQDAVVDGAGYTITGKADGGNNRQGVFHLFNESDTPVALTLRNTTIINKNGVEGNKWSDACGISVRASNQSVTLDHVTIDTSHYCIFVGVPAGESEKTDDVVLNITDSELSGYAAVYYRTNSTTDTINRPVLNVTASRLTGRGIDGPSNGFSTIVFNGTRDARATITDCTLSNSFGAENEDANQAVIQFNCYGAYEKNAVVTIQDSTVKTNRTALAPNLIKYTCMENLDAGNKVIIDNLTITVDENESDLIRVMRNENELVATGIDLTAVLEIKEHKDGWPSEYPNDYRMVVQGGDSIYIPNSTTLSKATTVPTDVVVIVKDGALLSGEAGVTLTVNGTVTGVTGIDGPGTYTWTDGAWTK